MTNTKLTASRTSKKGVWSLHPVTGSYPDHIHLMTVVPALMSTAPQILEDTPSKPSKNKKKHTKPDEKEEEDETPAKRARNYVGDEDAQICTSWLEISEDSTVGVDQAASKFWLRLQKHYLSAIPIPYRSEGSLKNRWSLIQHAVNQFISCLEKIDMVNPSGTTMQNQFARASKIYEEELGKSFTHFQALDILSNSVKWTNYYSELTRKKEAEEKRRKDDETRSPNQDPFNPLETGLNEPERPIGWDYRKALAKSSTSKKSTLFLEPNSAEEKLAESHAAMAVEAKRQNDLFEEHNIIAKRNCITLAEMNERSIMDMDLNVFDEKKRKYYEAKQKLILKSLNIFDV